MGSVSPRVRTVWRGIALVFAAGVVIVRLGLAACSPAVVGPAFVGPTKAGGGFNRLEPEQEPPAPPQTTAAAPRRDAAAIPEDDLPDPEYFPATKAGGGFYPHVRPTAAPQQQAGGNE